MQDEPYGLFEQSDWANDLGGDVVGLLFRDQPGYESVTESSPYRRGRRTPGTATSPYRA